MAAILDELGEGLVSTDVVPASTDFTWSAKVRISDSISVNGQVLLYRGNDPQIDYTEYVVLKVFSDGHFYIETSLGTQDLDAGVAPGLRRIQYTYTASTGMHRVLVDGVEIGTYTQSVNALTFTHEYVGTDSYDIAWEPSSAEEVREFDAALDNAGLAAEAASPVAVNTADLWRDTPLLADLLDRSGNDRDWATWGGTPSFVGALGHKFYIVDDILSWLGFTTYRGGWDVNPAVQRRLSLTKDNNSISSTNATESSAATGYARGMIRLISDPLAAQTISGTLDVLLGVQESAGDADFFFRVHAWISQGDTDSLRGTLLSQFEDSTGEWPTTGTGCGFGDGPQALTDVAVTEGDRLVIELGYVAQNATASTRTGTIWFGTRRANGDLTNGSTQVSGSTGLNGHILFSHPIALAPAPANDHCATATVIDGASLPFSDTLDTTYATGVSDNGEDPYLSDFEIHTHSVWYTLTADVSGTLEISTEGSTYGVSVAVFDGADTCGALPEAGEIVAAIDPTDSAPLVVPVVLGETYRILVQRDGSGGLGVAGTLEVAISDITPAAEPPDHDDCASPRVIASVPYEDADVDTTGATLDPDDPETFNHGTFYHSVHYAVTPEETGHYLWDESEADYETVIEVFEGACGSLTRARLQSVRGFRGEAGTPYHLIVGATSPGGGTLTFRLRRVSDDTYPPIGGAVGRAGDFSRAPVGYPLQITAPGTFLCELWAHAPTQSNIDPGPRPLGLELVYREEGTNDNTHVPMQYLGSGDPAGDGLPMVLTSDKVQDILGTPESILWYSRPQTLELMFQFSSRNIASGIRNPDGQIRVHVNGIDVPELAVDGILWGSDNFQAPRLGPYYGEPYLYGAASSWGVRMEIMGHLSAVYIMGEPRFASGFGGGSSGAGELPPADYGNQIPFPDVVERDAPATAAADPALALHMRFATVASTFMPGGPWLAYTGAFSSGPPVPLSSILVGPWERPDGYPPGPETIAIHGAGTMFSQAGAIELSTEFVPPPPPGSPPPEDGEDHDGGTIGELLHIEWPFDEDPT